MYAGCSAAKPLAGQSRNLNVDPGAPINGVVGDRDSFTFEVSGSASVLIQVKRINTDLKLVLTGTQNNLIYAVSFPTRGDWFAERILITANDCRKCRLQILPVEKVDQSGHYQLTAKWLWSERDAAELAFESKMTQASVMWLLADNNKNQLSQVYQTYLEAHALAKVLPSEAARQRSLYLAAEAAHYSQQFQTSKKLALAVANANQNVQDRYRLRAGYLLAQSSIEEQDLMLALSYLNKAETLAIAQQDLLMQASIINLYGLIAGKQGHSAQAYELFEKAYQLFAVAGDWRSAVNELINKGWSKNIKGELEIALNYFQQALSFSRSVGLLYQEVDASFRLGEVYGMWGDIDQANQYIDLAINKMQPFNSSTLVGRVWQAKGRVLFGSGMLQLAKVVLEDALQAYMQVKSKTDEIDIRHILGRVHSSLGEYKLAAGYFDQVLEFDKETGNRFALGQSYFTLAETALARGKYSLALNYQQQAQQYLNDSDDKHLKGELYSQAGIIYFYNNQLAIAEGYFSQAREIQQKIQDYGGQIETGYRLATTQAAQGNPEQALLQLNRVIDIIQAQRDKITRVDIKRNYLALQQKIGALKIKLLMQGGANAKSTLQASEMFRLQTLNERLKQLGRSRSISPELALKRSQLQLQLQSKVIGYHQLSNPVLRRALVDKTRKLAAQLQQLEVVVDAQQVAKAGLPERQVMPLVSVEQIQHRLDADTLILYFDTNPQESYLWTITHTSVDSYLLPADKVITAQVARALALTSQPPNAGIHRKQKQKNAYNKLVNTLFADKAIPWQKYAKLMIIADGPLNYLPFSMLTLPGQQTSLLEQKQISFMPSLAVLSQLTLRMQADKKTPSAGGSRILLLANPSFLTDKAIDPKVAKLRSGFNTSELPYTKKEAENILKITANNSVLLSRENASKQAFYAQSLGDFHILHFATHGLASNEAPSLGGLVFSNETSDNHLLLASEIANLQLNAELVVLSGCETALGRLIDGEGLQGLSRAFFDAGAKRVIASLWPVQDDATAELMGAFYHALLLDKQSPAQALRLAKLRVKNHQLKNKQKHWQDPYYWASFVLQGLEEPWLE